MRMSGSTTRPHRSRLPWLIPAVIAALVAALLFIGSVASNLVATDLDQTLKPYRVWVWVAFFVALMVAVVVAVKQALKPAEASERGKESEEPERGQVSDGQRNVVIAEGEAVVVRIPPAANALHQLPPPPRDFTGRKEELAELRSHIERGGVTISGLHGLGGTGKTTLALKLAEELKARYPDAQFYLDLKGVSSKPLTVAEALAHVVRAYHPTAKLPEGEAELRALYISVLEGKRALLLMDNARDAAQVEPLIPPDTCVLLVTSRQHFTLPGLYAKRLDTLTPAESRELLLKIAPRIGNSADDLATLCGQLPLALRLAASALAERENLTPADYLRPLPAARPRRGLVEASLSLSYDLLPAAQQKLWRALSVFPDTFDAPAAAAVWQTDADAAQDALGDLLNFSMLAYAPAPAPSRPPAPPRLFADSRLSDEERNAARMRHAEHYLRVLAECDDRYLQGGAAIKDGLARFDAERRNVEAGQEWACQHSGEDETAARLCNQYPNAGLYVLDLRQHPRDERIVWLEAALAAARRLKDRAAEGSHLGNLGIAYKNLGETRRAVEYPGQALVVLREIGDRRGEGAILGNLGNTYADLGEARRAVEYHEQQLVITREIGDRRGEGNALGNLGNAYADLGEARRAVEYHERQLVIAREIGDRRGEGVDLFNISLALDKLGDWAQAIAHAEAALEILEQIESPHAKTVRAQLAKWRGET